MAEDKDLQAQAAPEAESKAKKPKKAPKEPERQDITTLHERTIATLSYVSFLAIVPFYLKKDSEYCRFHGRQGMLLAIMFFIASVVTVIDLVFDILVIIQVSIFFYMGYKALSGRWTRLPFFYDWAVQIEDALTLRTKEEDMESPTLKPNENPTTPEAAAPEAPTPEAPAAEAEAQPGQPIEEAKPE